MRKTTIFGLFIFILTGNLYCQVQKDEIYEVLNQLIEINHVKVLSKKAKSFNIKDPFFKQFIDWCSKVGENRIDLSLMDSTFIEEQVKDVQEIRWEKIKIEKKIKIKRRSVDYFSIPLYLNKEKNIVLIYHSQCYGPLAGEGKYELYQKIDNKWKLVNVMPIWVS